MFKAYAVALMLTASAPVAEKQENTLKKASDNVKEQQHFKRWRPRRPGTRW